MAPTLKSLSFEVGVFFDFAEIFCRFKTSTLTLKNHASLFSMGHFVTDHDKAVIPLKKVG